MIGLVLQIMEKIMDGKYWVGEERIIQELKLVLNGNLVLQKLLNTGCHQ